MWMQGDFGQYGVQLRQRIHTPFNSQFGADGVTQNTNIVSYDDGSNKTFFQKYKIPLSFALIFLFGYFIIGRSSERKNPLSKAQRSKISWGDFVFPEDRTWPIHDEKHAKIALVWASWPQHKKVASKVRSAVYKKYPHLRKIAHKIKKVA